MTFHWANGAGGNWTIPSNWVGDAVPGGGSDVAIDATPTATSYTVTLNVSENVGNFSMIAAATLLVEGVTLGIAGESTSHGTSFGTIELASAGLSLGGTGAATFANLGTIEAAASGATLVGTLAQSQTGTATLGTLLALGSFTLLNNSDIEGGTLRSTGAGVFTTVGGQVATLDGRAAAVSVVGTVDVVNNANLQIEGTINTAGGLIAVQAAGNGTDLQLVSNVTLTGGGNVVLADSGNSIFAGSGAADALVNVNNTISGSGQLGGAGMSLTNESAGVIDATGTNTALQILAPVSNAGVIEDTGTAGLVVNDTTIVNSGTVEAVGSGAQLDLQGGVIQGGAVASSGGGIVQVDISGGFEALDGSTSAGAVTITGTVEADNNSTLNLLGSIINKGELLVGAAGNGTTLFVDDAAVTLTGGGQVVLADSPNSRVSGAVPADKLVNVNNTISGSGQLGAGGMSLDNQSAGIVNANGSNSTLEINAGAGTVSNEGLIEDTGAAGLSIFATNITNSGTIAAVGASAHVDLQLGTAIKGGTVASSGGGIVQADGGTSGTLDGSTSAVTVIGTVEADNNSTLGLLGTINNLGTLLDGAAGNGTVLQVASAAVSLTGDGQVVLSDSPNSIVTGLAAADVLVNVNNTISGSGQLGNGGMQLINDAAGVIDASGSGNALIVNLGKFVNAGVVEDTGSAGLVLNSTTIGNAGAVRAIGAGTHIDLQNGATIRGGNVTATGGGIVQVDGGFAGTLNGTTNGAIVINGTVEADNNATLNLIGSIVNKGTLLDGAAGNVTLLVVDSAAATLTGGGQVVLTDGPNAYILGAAATDQLVNVNNTISGSGQLGDGQLSLDNQAKGIIDANGTGTTLEISMGAGVTTNEGLIEDTGTAGLSVSATTIVNTGTVAAIGIGSHVDLQSGTIKGGTIATPVVTVGSATGNGVVEVDGGTTGTLDGSAGGITNLGTVVADNNSSLTLLGTINNRGTLLIDGAGNGTDLLAGSPSTTLTGGGQVQLTDSPNNLIQGDAVTLNGTVTVFALVNVNNVISGAGRIGAGQIVFDNQGAGTVDATGGNALTIFTGGGSFTNEGLLEASNPVDLANTGGLIVLATTIDNTGSSNAGVVRANASHVDLLDGGVIKGGTIVTTAGGVVQVDAGNIGTLDGSTAAVTINGTVEADNNSQLDLAGSIVNNGTLFDGAAGNGTYLLVDSAAVTLTGGGQVLLTDGPNAVIQSVAAADLLVNVNNTISGSGTLGNGALSLDNQAKGVIDADGTNTTLEINVGTGAITNEGLIEDTGVAGLSINGTTIVNTGTVAAIGIGAHIDLQGSSIKGGTIITPVVTVGSVTGSGVVEVDGGDSGTLDGSAGVLTNLGTVVADNNSSLTLLGTIANQGTLLIGAGGNGTDLRAGSLSTILTGGGQVVLTDSPNNLIQSDTTTVHGTETIFELVNVNNTIAGAGQIGGGQLVLDNQAAGTIDATGGNALVIFTGGGKFTNEGLLEASNPGALSSIGGLTIEATTINDSGNGNAGVLAANGSHVDLQDAAVIEGGTISTTAGGIVQVDSGQTGTLDGNTLAVTIKGVVAADNNSQLALVGTIDNLGTLQVDAAGNGTLLQVDSAAVTLTGGGQVTLTDSPNGLIESAAPGEVLVNANNTISGSGRLGDGQLQLINDAGGVIDATGSSNALIANLPRFVSFGLVEDTGTAGLVLLNNGINNAGTLRAVGTGTHIDLESGATIRGGTLTTGNGGIIQVIGGNAGTLDGTTIGAITINGTVAADNNASLSLIGSIVNRGTLLVAGAGNATSLVVASATVTLNGGGQVVLNDSPNSIIEGAVATDTLVNLNNTISGSGRFGNAGLSLDNRAAGTIDATGSGAELIIQSGAGVLSNEGLIEDTGTAGLLIFANTVVNTGSVVAVGASAHVDLQDGAQIVGGTVGSSGGGVLQVDGGNGGTLNGSEAPGAVTIEGTVAADNNATLNLLGTIANRGSLVAEGAGNATFLQVLSPVVTLTGGGQVVLNSSPNSFLQGDVASDKLVNVNNTISGGGNLGNALLNIDNQAAGVIDGSGGTPLTINVGTISNEGLIEATGAGGVVLAESMLTNFGSSGTVATITGGSYAGINNTLTLTGAGFATLVAAATLEVSGAGGQITIGGTAIDTMLTNIVSGGDVEVLGGRNFAATHAIDIFSGGTLQLGGGAFTTSVGGVSNAGRIVGFGTLVNSGVKVLANTGVIEANGGLLTLGTLSGAGSLQVDSGATLELKTPTAETVDFAGASATLRLDVPSSYTGTLDNIVPGDTLDLVGDKVASAAFSGNSLVVTLSGGGTLTYAIGTPHTGDLIAISNTTTDGFVKIYGVAQPGTVTPTPVAFGNHHVGDVVRQFLTVSNLAPGNGYYETIDASVSGGGEGINAGGSVSGVGGQQSNSTNLRVVMSTATAGAESANVTVTETSDGTAIAGLLPPITTALPTQTIHVTGAVYAFAAPSLSATTLTFSPVRVGGAAQSKSVTLSNGTTANAFQESLIYAEGPTTAPLAEVAPTSGTIVAGGSVALGFTLGTGTSGNFAATPVTVALTSKAGGAGLSNTVLTAGTIKVTGQVFQTASASLPSTLNFGIVHVGQVDNGTLDVTNSASGALVDSLIGGVAGTTGAPVTASGALNLGAGATGGLKFALNTATAEVFSGAATLALKSHDGVLADLAVPTGTVALTGTIDNYATADLTHSGAGTFAADGSNVELLTIATVKGTATSAGIAALNAAIGPADVLSGSYATIGSGPAFTNTGFAAFANLAAGASSAASSVTVKGAADGMFVEQFVLNATGSNASGYSGAVAAQTLDVEGGVGDAVLTSGANTVSLAGNDTILAVGGSLSSGDSINGGTGSNTLELLGAGTFDLRAPTTLTNIGTLVAQEGQGAFTPTGGTPIPDQSQYIDLRSGLNLTVDVTPAPPLLLNAADPNKPTIAIQGANDSSVINFGSGYDNMYLGSATETVNGGASSNGLVQANTAAEAGAKVVGLNSADSLELQLVAGGTETLNAADANVVVVLDAATNLTLSKMAFVSAIGDVSGNRITALASGQTLGGTAGGDTLIGFSGFGDTFRGTTTGLNNDVLKLFGGNDVIDLTNLAPSATPSYTGNTTSGVLKLTDGTHTASLTMIGNYTQSGMAFHIVTDTHGGSLVTYG
jgi:hypothetical protein